MSCARPVVLAIDGVARDLVCDQAHAGIFAEPENQTAIAAAITELAADPDKCSELGRSGRAWVLANASRDALASRYLDVMLNLVREKQGVATQPKPADHDGGL